MPPPPTRPAVEMPIIADPAKVEKEFTVLVTGFGPFRGLPINRSWSIVSALPPSIPLDHNKPTHTSQVKILVHPHPIRVSYTAVRGLIPTLLAAYPHVDAVIHVGLAGGRKWYAVERLAHRTGYGAPDVDGEFLAGRDWVSLTDEERGLDWPEEIKTTVDVESVWEGWKGACLDVDVRISDDPGRYLCDFIFYTSLANYWEKNGGIGEGERPVLFLHVPSEDEEGETLEKGVRVTVGLIRAVVETLHERSGACCLDTGKRA